MVFSRIVKIIVCFVLAVLLLAAWVFGIVLFINIASPIAGIAGISFMCIGGIILLIANEEKINRKIREIHLSIAARIGAKEVPYKLYSDLIAILLLLTIAFSFLYGLCMQTKMEREKEEAAVKAAIAADAPRLSINGFCVDGKVYVDDGDGNYGYITVTRPPKEWPMECRNGHLSENH